jgi:hypothetical protein
LDRTEIPRDNIKKRWTRAAGPQGEAVASSAVTEHATSQNEAMKRRVLIMKVLELFQIHSRI